MALADVSPTEAPTQVLVDNSTNVGIRVTANVCVTRNGSFSDGIQDPAVTIVTSLNAAFTEITAEHSDSHSVVGSGESCNVSLLKPLPSGDFFEQPTIRRSKKCTQLNNNSELLQQISYERAEIERTVILPYLGCTADNEFLTVDYKSNALIKSSKSLSYIQKKPSTMRNTSYYRSKSLSRPPTKRKATDLSEKNAILNEFSMDSFTDIELLTLNNKTENNPSVNKFNRIKKLLSDSQILFQDERNIKYRCIPFNDEMDDEYPLRGIDWPSNETSPNKSALDSYIAGFDQELQKQTCLFRMKATRNVSILHRPQTRNKATSTTSLNKEDQSIGDSIKGLLMPYISSDKRFPSELVLQLVTKKEFIESKTGKDKGNSLKPELTKSSDSNVLVPVLQRKKKRFKSNSFTKWFCKSKKKDNASGDFDTNSRDSLSREVYYPSVVEVFSKKKRKWTSKQSDSFNLSNDSSFIIVKKKK